MGHFQNLRNFFRNCLEFFWIFLGIFWIFWGIFLENFFCRIFLGGIFWEVFLGGIFCEEFFVYIAKLAKLFEYGRNWFVCQDFVSMHKEGRKKGRKEDEFQSLKSLLCDQFFLQKSTFGWLRNKREFMLL